LIAGKFKKSEILKEFQNPKAKQKNVQKVGTVYTGVAKVIPRSNDLEKRVEREEGT